MKRSTALAASALLATAIFTQAQSPAPRVQKSLLFLTQAQIAPSRLLAPPPKDGSEQIAVRNWSRRRRYGSARPTTYGPNTGARLQKPLGVASVNGHLSSRRDERKRAPSGLAY